MNMRQQIVDSRIADTAASLSVSRSQAFMRLAHSLVVRSSIVAFDANDLVDGGQDKQIDLFTIAEDGDSAEVYLIQVKDAETFQSTIVTQIRNGLDWVFNKKLHDVELLDNARFKNRIQEYRALQRNIGPSNIAVSVFHVTNGLTSEISREYEQEAKSIRDQFDNGTLSRFSSEPFGADELVQRINEIERGQQKVNCRIPIRYDSNNPSLIKYHAENLKGVVCTTTATELAKIVNSDTNNSVFESNVRTFLGGRGSVNSEIRKTCVNKDSSQLFWFLNNGITIVCDRFDAVTEPDNAHIIVENLQIVNGCQTAKTVAQAANSNELLSDTRVLLRIYETQDTGLVDQIVRTTNNENRISARDLWSNNEVQKDMERAFRTHGLLYERKPRQYDAKEGIDLTKVVPNELVAQSYLAVVLKRPSDARRRKYLVW